ncbi:MAG TPA: hypothetical protein VK207_02360 [Bacteroidales bacterium]|nr:hypothetical protein [Bacteroidales bacterium]
MKRYFIMLLLLSSVFSCRKETYSDAAVPEWLKLRISTDEAMIKSNPQLGLDAAAWLRFEWQSSYYYDYINLNNSSGAETYTSDGQKLSFSAESLATYRKERCCEHVVWRGQSYH